MVGLQFWDLGIGYEAHFWQAILHLYVKYGVWAAVLLVGTQYLIGRLFSSIQRW